MLVGGMERGRRGRGRGARRLAEEGLREEIRILVARLEVVEAGRRRDLEIGDDSEEEVEVAANGPEGESAEVTLLRSVLVASSKPKPELPTYDGSLSIEVLLEWISEMDKYFKCEEVNEDRRVKFVATILKGHAALWWDSVQNERKRLNKASIKTCSKMVAKLKGRFLRDYQIALHRQVQNLKQKGLTVREYTKEFYRVNLRAGYTEDTMERTARYVNALRLYVLDEINILSLNNTKETYQSAMKAEEKITRQNARRGRGANRGKGQSYGRGRTANNNEEGSSSKASGSAHREADLAGQRGAYVAQPKEAAAPPQEADNARETGEALVLHKVLLKPVKEVTKQTQWKALFRTICKSQGKCCKLIIDNDSTDNLVSTKMLEKLGLKHSKHPNPYRVSWLQKGH
eukprot:PITA_16313